MNEKIAEYIETLAQQLGVAITHLYEVMARQQIAEGIAYGILSLALIVSIPIAVFKLARFTANNYDDDWDFLVFIGWCIGGIAALITFVACLLNLPEYVMHIINPEYYVVKEILDVFK